MMWPPVAMFYAVETQVYISANSATACFEPVDMNERGAI